MANLGNDYPNDDADPIDSAPPRAAILHHGSTAKALEESRGHAEERGQQ